MNLFYRETNDSPCVQGCRVLRIFLAHPVYRRICHKAKIIRKFHLQNILSVQIDALSDLELIKMTSLMIQLRELSIRLENQVTCKVYE